MEDKMPPPPKSARESDTSVAIIRNCSPKHSQVSKEDLHEIVEDPGHVTIRKRQNAPEEDFQIISQRFPAAKSFLKERLATSVAQRRNSFLYWRHEARTFTASEEKPLRKPLDSEMNPAISTESTRWQNTKDFPKPPKIASSQSYFVCQICFLSTPSEEAKDDLWIQHVVCDLTPYICLLENCQGPQTAFSTFEEWIKHMKEEQSSTSDSLTSCPLCSYRIDRDDIESSAITDPESLQQHIAGHLQSLALFSLHLLYSDKKSEPDSSDSSGQAVQRRLDSHEPIATFGNQVYPNLAFSEREPSWRYGQRITFVPPPPPPAPRNNPNIEAWRQQEQEKQTTNTETFDILVAEDNVINQKLISNLLAKHHQKKVVLANNGLEALAAVKQRKYDVILMDESMPVMGGYEATEKIREYERRIGNTRTPIIGLFVSMIPMDIEKILVETQMDDYLCKPVRVAQLIQKVLYYGRMGRSAAGYDQDRFLDSIFGEMKAPRNPLVSSRSKL